MVLEHFFSKSIGRKLFHDAEIRVHRREKLTSGTGTS